MIRIKQLAVAFVIALVSLGGAATRALADTVQCHCSPGGALWCEDLDTGESWQATSYNSAECGGDSY